jgi:energy coupling factor transporter S component ThiW
MIGALLAGILYRKTNKVPLAIMGEIFGTGILGALVAFPIAYLVMGKNVAALFFVAPFLISTIGGSIIAYFLIKAWDFTKASKANRGV